MKISYNITGPDRKRLVSALGEVTGKEPKYLGAPSFAYEVGFFTVTREGALVCSDAADPDWVGGITDALAEQGFHHSGIEYDQPVPDIEVEDPLEDCPPTYGAADAPGLIIHLPFDETAASNLERLLEAKGALIKTALCISDLPVTADENWLSFPWFDRELEPDEAKAYTHFVTALYEMAKTQKRITAKEKDIDNEKYTFRCFLLRLGFIGAEFKTERKILLRNLTGSSAFKSNQHTEVGEEVSA